MKQKIIGKLLITGILGYFVWDAWKSRYDKVCRRAAGESEYENTHKKYGRRPF